MVQSKEYNSILQYIVDQISKGDKDTPVDIQRDCPYENWLAQEIIKKQQNKGKKIKKSKIEGQYKEEWAKFWNVWPSTKSVPGTNLKSGAVMKKDEAKMYAKWLSIIDSGKCTIEELQHSAECYLEWAYEESKKKGRNELQYRSGMEPWLNGGIYLTYKDMEMPIKAGPVEDLTSTSI